MRIQGLLVCICVAGFMAVPMRAVQAAAPAQVGEMEVTAHPDETQAVRPNIKPPAINPKDFSASVSVKDTLGGLSLKPALPKVAPPHVESASPRPNKADPAPAPAVSSSLQDLVPVRMDPPEFPREALLDHQHGYVVVEYVVDSSGNTSDIHVVKSEPNGVFDRAARRAVAGWKFKPYASAANSQGRQVRQTISFDPRN